MFHTASQVYGSYYKNKPSPNLDAERKFQSEPRNYRSLSPTKPSYVTDNLAEAARSKEIVYRPELTLSPFINGQKNVNFQNRSMIACDALAAPIYDGANRSGQKRDMTRYQPYLSPQRKADKGMAPKIGHEVYPEMSPTRLSPDGKLPWQREEIPKQAVKKLEFEVDAGAKKQPELHTPVKSKQENINQLIVQEPKPVVEKASIQAEEKVTAQPEQKVSPPREEKQSAPREEKLSAQQQQNDDIPYYQKRAVSVPNRWNNQPAQKRIQTKVKEPEVTNQNKASPIRSDLSDIGDSPSVQDRMESPDIMVRSLAASPVRPQSAYYRTSASKIGEFFAKQLRSPTQLQVIPENNRPQSAFEFREIPAQNIETQEKGGNNLVEVKTPMSCQSGHSGHSCCSNESGKNLLCDICVNKRLKNYKDLEKAQLREHEIQKELDDIHRLDAAREQERERLQKIREAAMEGTNAVKEALDKKFNDYWEQKRNAGKNASEENELREQQLEKERAEAFYASQKNKEEYRADLLKQIQENQDQKEREKLLNQAPGQNMSLTSPSFYVNGSAYSPEQLRQDLLKQIEEKEEQRRKEFEDEKARHEQNNARNERMYRDNLEKAERYHLEKREAARRAIEEGIAEQQAKKEQALLEKQEERDMLQQREDLLRQTASDSRQSRKDFQKGYAQELQKQMEEDRANRAEERRRDREPYETSMSGYYAGSKDPRYFENLLKQHQEERAKLREEYQQQIAEKKRQREQEKEEDRQWANNGLLTSGPRNNHLLELQKSYHEDLAEQIRQKEQGKLEAGERDRREARELKDRLHRTEEQLRQQAYENHQKQRDEFRKGLDEGLYYKQLEKDAQNQEKANERANVDAMNKLAKSQLLQQLLHKNAHARDYSEALAAQIQGNSAAKAYERELDRMPYGASITSPVKNVQKLYSCMDCSKKLPKYQLTKKSAIEPAKKVTWQKY